MANLPSSKEKRRGRRAFRWLMQQADSAYGEFVELHRAFLRRQAMCAADAAMPRKVARLPVSFLQTVGLECALWPDLYWCTSMTETYARSQDARRLRRTENSEESRQSDDEGGQDAETVQTQQLCVAGLSAAWSAVYIVTVSPCHVVLPDVSSCGDCLCCKKLHLQTHFVSGGAQP